MLCEGKKSKKEEQRGEHMPGVLLCSKCTSDMLDVIGWKERTAVIECLTCGKRSMLVGATVGRVELTKEQLQVVQRDMARPWVREV